MFLEDYPKEGEYVCPICKKGVAKKEQLGEFCIDGDILTYHKKVILKELSLIELDITSVIRQVIIKE